VWHYPYPLDEAMMQEVAAGIVGEHDFTSFAAVDPERRQEDDVSDIRQNVRQIFCSSWRREAEELIYTVRGSGFLHHMVRNLVGTFLLAGKGALKPPELTQILTARSRSAAGATAPASGLCLVSVEY
jgi:tRNA pseudouridine38-40 synthase